jgi:putative Mg2+ transporter-C (MgtC) family protein
MSTFEMFIRLLAAVLAGGAIGLNRELHSKQTGVRTLGLVSLGAAAATVAAAEYGDGAGATRVMQGILTGIGFLGAGVIIRPAEGSHIHGLTTAACTWVTACVGVICAVADTRLIVITLVLAFVVLIWGGPFEKGWHQRSIPANESPPASE